MKRGLKKSNAVKKKSVQSAKPKARADRKQWSARRSTTHRPNGSLPEGQTVAPAPEEKVTIGEAMRRAVEELGEVLVDDRLAPQQLRELGTCYEEVARRQAAYDAKAEEAKTAKKSLEGAQELLLEKVRAYTHPSPLPLFDQKQAEQDREDMLDAADEEDDADAAEAQV